MLNIRVALSPEHDARFLSVEKFTQFTSELWDEIVCTWLATKFESAILFLVKVGSWYCGESW